MAAETGVGVETRTCPVCSGTMHKPHTSQDLYAQLSYLQYLFDHKRQRDNLLKKHAALPTLSQLEMETMDAVRQEVDKFLDSSNYRFLDLSKLAHIMSGKGGAAV